MENNNLIYQLSIWSGGNRSSLVPDPWCFSCLHCTPVSTSSITVEMWNMMQCEWWISWTECEWLFPLETLVPAGNKGTVLATRQQLIEQSESSYRCASVCSLPSAQTRPCSKTAGNLTEPQTVGDTEKWKGVVNNGVTFPHNTFYFVF